ncbi:ATP-binding protein [Methanoregula formicica]|uniref:CO dehydrogenase maturation factor n=1 Tax=Methanoregula formicica (strain DSM 22288 / NBRC 105244 / SMSP) TaxID=593750 RepID=L0HG44_METFS|nr:AAA family ATPase [Methanoregula formicica]AGB02751.1 CO dehydrogenase maturation factor [Methanoregula formicica SMSP]
MKIAVCGKGGVGKTFLAGSLAAYFASISRPVIAIDADSSPNLALTLGLTEEEASRIQPVAENEELIRVKTATDHPGVFRLSFSVDDIIAKYAVRTPSGAHLLVMGTIKAAGSGCTCPAHSVVRALMRHLVVERDEVVILDMEAGIEHLGRGTAARVDVLLAVSDANKKSLLAAATICRLANEAGIPVAGIVANRNATPEEERIVRAFAEQHGLHVVGNVPYDPAVTAAGIAGEPAGPRQSLAWNAVRELAGALEKTKRPEDKSRGNRKNGVTV